MSFFPAEEVLLHLWLGQNFLKGGQLWSRAIVLLKFYRATPVLILYSSLQRICNFIIDSVVMGMADLLFQHARKEADFRFNSEDSNVLIDFNLISRENYDPFIFKMRYLYQF